MGPKRQSVELHYTKLYSLASLASLAKDKNYSLFGSFVIYEENEVL
jgi:hypothetical protein